MNSAAGTHNEEHLDRVVLFALQALPPGDRASAEAQISACEDCRQEIETLRGELGRKRRTATAESSR